MDEQEVDISSEFTCFLCNGDLTFLGSIRVETQFIRLSTGNGVFLEDMYYSSIVSVLDEDPPTTHSLFLNKRTHSVYVCHLLRKDKLLKVFKELNLYKGNVKLSAEAFGFTSSETLKISLNPRSELSNDLPENFDSLTWESKSRSQGSASHIQTSTALSAPNSVANNSQKSLSFPQTTLGPTLVIYSSRPSLYTSSEYQLTGTSGGMLYTQPTAVSVARRDNKSKLNVEVVHDSSTKRKNHVQTTYENETSHVDNLKILFPDYSSEDLQKILSCAHNDFDLALSYILLEKDLPDKTQESTGQPLTVTEV